MRNGEAWKLFDAIVATRPPGSLAIQKVKAHLEDSYARNAEELRHIRANRIADTLAGSAVVAVGRTLRVELKAQHQRNQNISCAPT